MSMTDENVARLYKYIGKKLKEKRRALGKKQEDIAAELHVSRTSVTNIESGIQKAPIYLLYNFCHILNAEIFDIMPKASDLKKTRNVRVHGTLTKELSEVLEQLK